MPDAVYIYVQQKNPPSLQSREMLKLHCIFFLIFEDAICICPSNTRTVGTFEGFLSLVAGWKAPQCLDGRYVFWHVLSKRKWSHELLGSQKITSVS